METRWDCVTSRHFSHLAGLHPICRDSANCLLSVNWPACPNSLFHSIPDSVFLFRSCFVLPDSVPSRHPLCLSLFLFCASLDPDTASDDVTLSGELTVWGESYYFAPAVWVKSPLTEIREHCLLGPALLQLPHRHTWRAPLHCSARLDCHTLQNVLYGRGQLLRTVCGSVGVLDWCWRCWTRSGENLNITRSFTTVGCCAVDAHNILSDLFCAVQCIPPPWQLRISLLISSHFLI